MANPFDQFDTSSNPFDRFDNIPVVQANTREEARAFARGVPIIGGALDEMNAATNAALDPVVPQAVSDFFGWQRIPGNNFSERYQNELARQRGDDAAYDKAHPYASTAMQLAGGIASGGAALKAGVPVLGGSGSLAQRAAVSSAIGGGTGAVDGFTRGEGGVQNRAESGAYSAGVGALIGGLAPVAAAGVGAAARGVMDALDGGSVPGVSRAVSRQLTNVADEGALARARELGPDAMLLDTGASLRGFAAGGAQQPGVARTIFSDALGAREQGANQRIQQGINAALGPAPVPSQLEAVMQASRRSLGPDYQQALAGARAVDTRGLADNLDAAIVDQRGAGRAAVQRVRDMLNIHGTDQLDPSPQALLNTRQAIDGMLAKETDTNAQRLLATARKSVDDEIARSIPGIKDVDARYAELARQSEGLQAGGRVLDGGKTAIRPSELNDMMNQGVQPQGAFVGPSGEAFRLQQGTRAEIDRLVGTTANDRIGLKKAIQGEGDWNRTKLEALFGKAPTDDLLRLADKEATYAASNQLAFGGSQTAPRQAAAEFFGRVEAPEVNPASTMTGLAANAAQKAWRTVGGRAADSLAEARRAEMARILVSTGEARDKILRSLANAPAREAARGRSADAIGRVAGLGLLGLPEDQMRDRVRRVGGLLGAR
ncbi:conserved hypothetical protein [Hyphomicrobiales bacterium]|nr:conserved hypothetical protein [Hyphomicrobiales bacterium]CAH1668439.1 conserved hypothetical protein [Hyphomicrobiales bacterium]